MEAGNMAKKSDWKTGLTPKKISAYNDAVECVKAVLNAPFRHKRKQTTIMDFLGLRISDIPEPPFPNGRTYYYGMKTLGMDDSISGIWSDFYRIGWKGRHLGEVNPQRTSGEEWKCKLGALSKVRKTLMTDLRDFTFNKACPAALNWKPLTINMNLIIGGGGNLNEHEKELLRSLIADLISPELFLKHWLDSIQRCMERERNTAPNDKDILIESMAYGERPIYPRDNYDLVDRQDGMRGLYSLLQHPSQNAISETIAGISAYFGHEIDTETIRKSLQRLNKAHKPI
jgi:hypothetical protein